MHEKVKLTQHFRAIGTASTVRSIGQNLIFGTPFVTFNGVDRRAGLVGVAWWVALQFGWKDGQCCGRQAHKQHKLRLDHHCLEKEAISIVWCIGEPFNGLI